MELTLTVTLYNNRPPEQALTYTWAQQGGSLGRAVDNVWVLPDPQKVVSGKHALIEYQDDGYWICDTSTNGLFINGSVKPLGKGNRVRLQAGDVLRLGLYELTVALRERSLDAYVALNPLNNDIPAALPDHFSNQPDQIITNYSNDDPFDFLIRDAIAVSPAEQPKQARPLLVAEQVIYMPEPQPVERVAQKPVEKVLVDTNPKPELIPNDLRVPLEWVNLLDTPSPPKPDLGGENQRIDESIEKVIPDFILEQPEPLGSAPQLGAGFDPFLELNKPPSREAVVSPTPNLSLPEQPSLSDTVRAPNDNQAIAAFFQGLGLELTQAQVLSKTPEDLLALGHLMRIAIQGTLDVLHARAEIKSALRMDMTTIQRIGNNPLKFSISAQDALNKLLLARSEAYLSPEQALNEAYEDIKAHQLAVMAGVQSALKQVLKRFEPNKLVERLEKNNPISANIPIQRQAKLWGLFETLYTELEQECADDFQRLFGLEFVRAYEAQIAQLKGAAHDGK